MRVRRHPSHQTLSCYIDEELTEARHSEVDEHLEGCLRCRREVDFMAEVQRGLREIAKPRPPRDVLEHILERREAGERIILPTAWASPRRLKPAVPAVTAVAAALFAAAVGLMLLDSREAAAGASGMEFSPSNLAYTHEIEIEYRTAGALAGEPKLRVRGRYLTADDDIRFGAGGSFVSADLWPGEDGTFQGTLRLPGSAVYAQFAVEDEDGEYVDHNGYLSWDLVAEYEDGRPKFEALWQRARAFQERDRQEAYESIKRLTELYPDRVEGWSARYGYERAAIASVLTRPLESRHRSKFAGFLEQASRGALSATELGALVDYARRLGDRPAVEMVASELQRLYPSDPIAVGERVVRLRESLRGEPQAMLRELEREWERVGPTQPLLVEDAYEAATKTRDPAAIRQWTDRLVALEPSRTPIIARDLEGIPSVRPYVAELIRVELRRLEEAPEISRPLHLGVSEYRDENRRLRHDLLARLGRMLVAEGRVEAGVDTLLLAAETGWDPELFAELGALSASRGDVTTARRYSALAAVDPLIEHTELEALHARGDRLTTESSWEEALEAAREEQKDRLYEGDINRRLPDGIVLRDQGRAVRQFESLLGEGATIVLLWSRWERRTIEVSRKLGEYRDRLAPAGVEILAITRDPDAEGALNGWRELNVDLPAYLDPRGRATAAMGSFAFPDLLVLDAGGRVRFADRDADGAARAALTLAGAR
jgi:hypothetical protein